MAARLAAIAILLTSVTASAASRVDEIRARGKLIVSVKNDAKKPHKDPAHYDKRGFEVELSRAIAKHILGDESRLELRLLSRPTRLPMLSTGAVDLVISMIPVTPENARQSDFSHPYFVSGLSLLLREGAKPLTLDELGGKTIAFRKQSFNDYGRELQRAANERGVAVVVKYFATFDEAANAVAHGDVAAMGGNFVDLEAYRRAHAGFAMNPKLLAERLVAVAVKKGDDDVLRLVNETIDALKKSGELKRMTERWHLPYLLGDR